MPDDAFEELWRLPGGAELVVLHGMFGGRYVPIDQVRQALGTGPEAFDRACRAAGRLGLVEVDETRIAFVAFMPDSSQRGRLDYALEPHREELEEIAGRIKGALLVRFLNTPPQDA